MNIRTIYLDNAATTRPDKLVVEAMQPWLREHFGNPSSLHSFGYKTFKALEEAREEAAGALKTSTDLVTFTSSGSDSNNLVIKGLLNKLKGKCVITTRLEHPSVLEPVKFLQSHRIPVHFLDNDSMGYADLNQLESLLKSEEVGLVSIIHGSNEVGVIQDVETMGDLIQKHGKEAWFHLDGVQTFGHLDLNPKAWGLSSLTVSPHKFHGPRGVGVLARYKKSDLEPLVLGGGQENGLRSGTENVAAIMGGVKALKLALERQEKTAGHTCDMKNALAEKIQSKIPDIRFNGDVKNGLPHILSVSFAGILGEVLLNHLEEKGVMVSTGSACHSKWKDLSETLKSLKIPKQYSKCTLRFSFSHETTLEEVQYTVKMLESRTAYLREVGL